MESETAHLLKLIEKAQALLTELHRHEAEAADIAAARTLHELEAVIHEYRTVHNVREVLRRGG